jgi:D-glycero-D-manno-heptose 1,7-bisphosphate phosphatase
MMAERALFLDRDGVINVNHGYVHMIDDVDFVGGIFELVSAAKKTGYKVVVTTNQSGIGRGLYSEAVFKKLMEWMRLQFVARGGNIDAVYFCPHHPEHGIGEYRRESCCRKPAPGMFFKASKEHFIDLSLSVMVGDSLTDVQAGIAAGIGKIFYLGDQIIDQAHSVSNLCEIVPFLEDIDAR